MDTTGTAEPSPADETGKKYLSVRQTAFIGVGAMVGAGIFALLGAAGEVAGAAVWLSFLIAGFVAVRDVRVHHPHPRARFDRHAGGHPTAERGPGLRVETQPPQSSGGCPGRSLVR